jgi:hypothetical protein
MFDFSKDILEPKDAIGADGSVLMTPRQFTRYTHLPDEHLKQKGWCHTEEVEGAVRHEYLISEGQDQPKLRFEVRRRNEVDDDELKLPPSCNVDTISKINEDCTTLRETMAAIEDDLTYQALDAAMLPKLPQTDSRQALAEYVCRDLVPLSEDRNRFGDRILDGKNIRSWQAKTWEAATQKPWTQKKGDLKLTAEHLKVVEKRGKSREKILDEICRDSGVEVYSGFTEECMRVIFYPWQKTFDFAGAAVPEELVKKIGAENLKQRLETTIRWTEDREGAAFRDDKGQQRWPTCKYFGPEGLGKCNRPEGTDEEGQVMQFFAGTAGDNLLTQERADSLQGWLTEAAMWNDFEIAPVKESVNAKVAKYDLAEEEFKARQDILQQEHADEQERAKRAGKVANDAELPAYKREVRKKTPEEKFWRSTQQFLGQVATKTAERQSADLQRKVEQDPDSSMLKGLLTSAELWDGSEKPKDGFRLDIGKVQEHVRSLRQKSTCTDGWCRVEKLVDDNFASFFSQTRMRGYKHFVVKKEVCDELTFNDDQISSDNWKVEPSVLSGDSDRLEGGDYIQDVWQNTPPNCGRLYPVCADGYKQLQADLRVDLGPVHRSVLIAYRSVKKMNLYKELTLESFLARTVIWSRGASLSPFPAFVGKPEAMAQVLQNPLVRHLLMQRDESPSDLESGAFGSPQLWKFTDCDKKERRCAELCIKDDSDLTAYLGGSLEKAMNVGADDHVFFLKNSVGETRPMIVSVATFSTDRRLVRFRSRVPATEVATATHPVRATLDVLELKHAQVL